MHFDDRIFRVTYTEQDRPRNTYSKRHFVIDKGKSVKQLVNSWRKPFPVSISSPVEKTISKIINWRGRAHYTA